MTKVNFHFYRHCIQATTGLICKQAIFAQNASMVSSYILYIEKKSSEKISGN